MELNVIVPSLYRGLAILELLSKEELRFNEIKNKLNIPKPSLSALLRQLKEEQYVEKDKVSKKHKLGKKLLVLGSVVLQKIDLRDKAKEEMEKLRQRCDETIELGILDRGEILFIDKRESSHSIRLFTQIGNRFTRLHASAPGKVALAWMENEERKEFFSHFSPLLSVTNRTITNRKKLLEQLEKIRSSCYAWDDQEARIGVRRFASPLLDHNSKLAGIISIAGPVQRLKLDRKREFASLIKKAALNVSLNLGYKK